MRSVFNICLIVILTVVACNTQEDKNLEAIVRKSLDEAIQRPKLSIQDSCVMLMIEELNTEVNNKLDSLIEPLRVDVNNQIIDLTGDRSKLELHGMYQDLAREILEANLHFTNFKLGVKTCGKNMECIHKYYDELLGKLGDQSNCIQNPNDLSSSILMLQVEALQVEHKLDLYSRLLFKKVNNIPTSATQESY